VEGAASLTDLPLIGDSAVSFESLDDSDDKGRDDGELSWAIGRRLQIFQIGKGNTCDRRTPLYMYTSTTIQDANPNIKILQQSHEIKQEERIQIQS
jgi:hypothetical protein